MNVPEMLPAKEFLSSSLVKIILPLQVKRIMADPGHTKQDNKMAIYAN